MMECVNLVIGSKLTNFVRQTFPSYRKRKVYLSIHYKDLHTITTHPGGWDGGSIEYDYIVSRIAVGEWSVNKARQATLYNFDREAGFPKVLIDRDQCMVTDGVVSSKPATLYINCTKGFFEHYLDD